MTSAYVRGELIDPALALLTADRGLAGVHRLERAGVLPSAGLCSFRGRGEAVVPRAPSAIEAAANQGAMPMIKKLLTITTIPQM